MGETWEYREGSEEELWKGLEAEYKKIIWPDKETLQKETAAVVAGAVALGLIIAALDTGIVFLLHYII